MYLAGVDSRESSFISAKKLSCWLLILWAGYEIQYTRTCLKEVVLYQQL
jgi:hypothetical protein